MKVRQTLRKQKGFNAFDLLVVVVICGIMVAIISMATDLQKKQNEQKGEPEVVVETVTETPQEPVLRDGAVEIARQNCWHPAKSETSDFHCLIKVQTDDPESVLGATHVLILKPGEEMQ